MRKRPGLDPASGPLCATRWSSAKYSAAHGACIDRTCADRDADGLDDDTCPDAPSTEPSYENRRLRLIRCAGAEDCEEVCPMCWVDELERELSERSIRLSKPSGGARAALAPALVAAALLPLVCI